ncbi:MAG: NAD(P)-dependent alcohol dehydrogenase [Desulfovibrionales bacterium]|nr:NAD(P)-dependent alcohol dehydrogenase [Desulfovibrionales bacterium]
MTVDMMKTLVLYPEKDQEQRVTIEERPVPVPELGEVLVRVHATTVCGRDKRLFSGGELGWRMEKNRKEYGAISGVEFSGVIATDGNDFAEGDAVYGCVDLSGTSFAHAEYVRVPEVTLVAKPNSLSFEEAATAPIGCMAAIRALQEIADIQRGQRLLMSGATGGIGVYALQLAKHMGAHISAQGRAWHEADLLRMGADRFIEYTQEEILHSDETFDVVFDIAAVWNFDDIVPHLTSKGLYITTHPERDIIGLISSVFSAKKSKYLHITEGDRDLLMRAAAFFEGNEWEPIVGSVSSFEEAAKEFIDGERKVFGRRVLKLV